MDVSTFNCQKREFFRGGQQGRGSRFWQSGSAFDENAVGSAVLNADTADRSPACIREDFPEGITTVCRRQVVELSEKLTAVGVRVVFFDSRSECWLWADGVRSDRFTQLCPNPLVPARVRELHGENLSFNLVTLSPADSPKIDSRTSHVEGATAYRYVCLLSRLDDGDEYLSIATECPLTLSQQKSVNQRAHLLRDYLQANRAGSERNALELEQRLQKVEHQLRNPLAAIELFADTLILQLPSGELRKQAEAIQTTVRDLDERLSLFQETMKQPSNRKQWDLRSIALDAIAVLQPSWKAKQVSINIPDKPLPVTVNRSQIQQVFENLLSNAIYFSPPASEISCEWVAFHREISVKVNDRGSGISPQDIELAFSPHYSRRPGGKGLGLAIAKSFVREHGGDIWCQSLPGGGTQFCFTLKSMAVH